MTHSRFTMQKLEAKHDTSSDTTVASYIWSCSNKLYARILVSDYLPYELFRPIIIQKVSMFGPIDLFSNRITNKLLRDGEMF